MKTSPLFSQQEGAGRLQTHLLVLEVGRELIALGQRTGTLDGLLLCLFTEDGLGVLELRAARPLVAGQEKVSVELAVEVLGPEASAVGHWDTTVATAGVHRGAHLTAGSISFNTNTHTHTEHTEVRTDESFS